MRPTDLDALDDVALVDLVRDGDAEAFGQLWRRHAASVTSAVRGFTGYDPDDVTSEAFARVLRQLRAGGGPQSEPRAYLVRAARNVAIEWARRDGAAASDELDEDDLLALAIPDHSDRVVQREATRAAYKRLPERWRRALWMREVEDLPVGECARLLGATPNSTTVLLKRAREGFAQEWIREHISRAGDGECGWVVARLPRYARGRSTPADAQRITRHLAHCRDCAMNGAEARHLHERLVLVLLPALLLAPGVHRLVAPSQASDAALAASVASGAGRAWLRSPRVLAAAGTVVALTVASAVAVSALNSSGAPAAPPGAAAPADEVHADDLAGPPAATTPAAGAPAHDAEASVAPAAPSTQPRTAASASPSPGAPSPQSTPSAPAEPGFVERAITVNPIPSAAGLYPTISGTASSGASVSVRVTGGGRASTHVFTASSSGAWSFTPRSVTGLSTAEFSQTYTTPGGQTVTAAGPTVTFTVDQLVDGGVVDVTGTTSALMLLGPAGASVEVESAVPGVSGVIVLDGGGSASVATPMPRGDVGGIRWRLVSGDRVGPWGS